MKVNYGPPGHKGVTQIMGLGADEAVVSELPNLKEKVATGGMSIVVDTHRVDFC